MAQRQIFVDDLDSSVEADVETVKFGLHGAAYEIDLGKSNRAKLDKALEPFLAGARRDPSAPSRRGGTVAQSSGSRVRTSSTQAKNDAVRAWAKENGHQVSERGRIANSVIEAYEAANPGAN